MYFGRILNVIETLLQLSKDFPKVLDIGGGLGLFSLNFKLNFPKSDVFILDYSQREGIKEILTKNPNLRIKDYIQADIQEKTPFDSNSFDLIFALDILEHVENP
ncbi:MAG: class I SAM-dependent methyltransferase, partial [Promethearchaeota archaeon]